MLAKNSFVIFIVSCFVVGLNAQIRSFSLECDFGNAEILGTERYACTVSGVDYDFSVPFYFIRIIGQHAAGRTNDDVQNLVFRDSTINRIPANIFNVFPNIQGLEVVNVGNISMIPPDFFFANQLRVVRMVNNTIDRIVVNTFLSAINLDVLILENNGIRELAPLAFNGLVNLTQLSIANNRVSVVTPRTLLPLQNLRIFDASNNAVEEIDGRIFVHNPLVEIVNFSGNNIRAIGLSILNINSNLQQFWLQGNNCANQNFVLGDNVNLETIRAALTECFANSRFGTQIVLNVVGNLVVFDENDQVLLRVEN